MDDLKHCKYIIPSYKRYLSSLAVLCQTGLPEWAVSYELNNIGFIRSKKRGLTYIPVTGWEISNVTGWSDDHALTVTGNNISYYLFCITIINNSIDNYCFQILKVLI